MDVAEVGGVTAQVSCSPSQLRVAVAANSTRSAIAKTTTSAESTTPAESVTTPICKCTGSTNRPN